MPYSVCVGLCVCVYVCVCVCVYALVCTYTLNVCTVTQVVVPFSIAHCAYSPIFPVSISSDFG